MDGERIIPPDAARAIAVQVLEAYGATAEHAVLVAGHLIDSDMSGVRSHGFLRLPQYVQSIVDGEIDPVASPVVGRADKGRANLDAARCFGQVAGVEATRLVEATAQRNGIGMVTVHEAGHTGRLGAYAEELGSSGYLALVVCSGSSEGHRVAPIGGRRGRLATNPIAFAVPSNSDPIVGDFSTAAAPEGAIRVLRNLGVAAPPDTLLDAAGLGTTDPNVLYEDPPGSILPLGGMSRGHRGFALAILVEALATLLAGDGTEDPSRTGSNLAFLAVSVDEEFRSRTDRLIEYIRDAEPSDPATPILLPGEREYRMRRQSTGVRVDEKTWHQVTVLASQRGIHLERL
jgi:LDH2 family malate/lactate/ureidoglycolate dehydrogenase